MQEIASGLPLVAKRPSSKMMVPFKELVSILIFVLACLVKGASGFRVRGVPRLAMTLDSQGAGVGNSLIICGPSGAGKGTVITRLLERFPGKYALCVSHTSRAPRPNEIDGTHYHFVSRESMLEDIETQKKSSEDKSKVKFLEYAEVHNNLYGTSLSSVQDIHGSSSGSSSNSGSSSGNVGMGSSKVAILDVDSKGVMSIKRQNLLPAKYLFLVPPSLQVLEQRLRIRDTETEAQLELRLINAEKTLLWQKEHPGLFDLILENDDLEETVDSLVAQMEKWYF